MIASLGLIVPLGFAVLNFYLEVITRLAKIIHTDGSLVTFTLVLFYVTTAQYQKQVFAIGTMFVWIVLDEELFHYNRDLPQLPLLVSPLPLLANILNP